MIGKIIQAITSRMEAYVAREDALFNASRRFTIALTFARKASGGEVYILEQIDDICFDALKASETGDLQLLTECVVRMEEFI